MAARQNAGAEPKQDEGVDPAKANTGKADDSGVKFDAETALEPRPEVEAAEVSEDETDVVTYIGSASHRRITKEQWSLAGVGDMDGVEWTFANDFKVPASVLSESALKVLSKDSGFRIPAQ